MENRFGFKDLLTLLLLLAIAVMIGLKLVQDDRHWEVLMQLNRKLDQQTSDFTSLKRTISEGGVSIGAAQPGARETKQDIFRRLRQVRQQPKFAEGGTVVETFSSAVPKLSFLTGQDIYGRVIYCKVLEPLVQTDLETLEDVPYLAESWSWSDDKLALTVKLRRNVVFSDGQPMSAADVVHTWQLLQDPEITDGELRAYYRFITKVEAVDDFTVRFNFSEIHYENFGRATGVPVLPKHFYSKYTKREIREHPSLLMGTGPYRVKDPTRYTPGETIELVRNERYWGVPGGFERFIYRIIEKDSTQLVAFRNGELDVYVPTPDQHKQMLTDKPLVDRTQHYVYSHVRTGYYYISWNQERGGKPTVFADKRVRQAMTMLIDRQRMIDEIFLGFAVVADGPFHPEGPQHNPKIEPWPYDVERAIKLLESAGFKRDSAGRMLTPQGTPFEITFSYGSGSELIHKVALFLKDNLARAGITLVLDPQEWTLLLKNMTERNFAATMAGWGAGGLEGDIEQMFHTRNIKEGDNRNAYSNPTLDKLIEKAHVTLDEPERMKIWHQTHEILHEDQPYTFLTFSKVRLWADKKIANIQRIPVFGVNYVSTWAVPIEWYIPADMQKSER